MIECFLDVLDRVGHTEAQIAIAEVAESGAGERGMQLIRAVAGKIGSPI